MLKKLIAECTDYDFKEFLEERKPRSWLKSISAFANGVGGSLFFGVADNGDLSGLADPQYVSAKITELINARIDPVPVYFLTPYAEDGKNFIELNVLPGRSTPYYYRFDGVCIAYCRLGNESVEAPPYLLNELVLKGMGKTYDTVATGLKKDDYSFSLLKAKFKEKTGTDFSEQDFVSFGLSNPDGFLTNAGVLFADENPYRQSRLFCTRWNGLDKTNEYEASDDLEISGSLIRQFTIAMDFFKGNTKRKWHKGPSGTVYEPDYDEEAILEAIVNGIIHRDYNNMGSEVCLNIYDDRIEITSPGGMYSGKKIPIEVNFTMQSSRRNPVIVDLFWRMGLMNRRGSGLAKITNRTNSLFDDGANHVFYHTDGSFFSVVIQNANHRKPSGRCGTDGTISGTDGTINSVDEPTKQVLSENESKVLSALKAFDGLSYDDISSNTGIPRRTVSRIIVRLQEKGYIVRRGSNKNGHWAILK